MVEDQDHHRPDGIRQQPLPSGGEMPAKPMKSNAQLMAEVTEEIRAVNGLGYTLRIDLGLTELLAIIGALQLALRHPGYADKPTAQTVRNLIAWADVHLMAFPAIRELIKRGFDPGQDQEP
jgi:hypothetical protein